MITTHVKLTGPLFDKKVTPKKVIQEAIQETADWTKNRLRNRSPVRTGKLKAGWYTVVGNSSIRIENPVPYTKYVEAKVSMVGKTTPEVNNELNEILLKKTNKFK